jgi:hypothetical protein
MTLSRLRSILVAGALSLLLVGIAAWAYDRGAEDWRWQLSGVMEDPLFLRGVPGLTMIVLIVFSALVGVLALISGAVVRRMRPSPTRTGDGSGWHWWWLLIAGWGGYVVGGAVVIVGGGPVDHRGSMHIESGAPLGSVADIPATCRSVVGEPYLMAQVIPAVDGLVELDLRNVATGRMYAGMPTLPVRAFVTDDGVPGNDFPPPNVPVRPLPHASGRDLNGPIPQPPISFVRAYDYVQVTRLTESGLSGVAQLTGVRFKDLIGIWTSLAIPDDPWPDTYELTVRWTCEMSRA